MKVLCLIPPQVPSYFNAGHHLPVFQVAAYLRERVGHLVTAVDASALNASWKDICDLLSRNFDAVVIFNDFDAVDTFGRTVYYAKSLLPHARLITFGRLSKQNPGWFTRFDIDAIVTSGDYEAGVEAALKCGNEKAAGVWSRQDGVFHCGPSGTLLPPEQWVFPNVEEIPYVAYGRLYANDLNKFCGIPDRQELVVPIARGCPIGCDFCDVPRMQGKNERRVSVEHAVSYIVESFTKLPFEYVSFYAPTFTLDRRWVIKLCKALEKLNRSYQWKCVTTLRHLNEELIFTMSCAGCVRISVGIETFNPSVQYELPKAKQLTELDFDRVMRACTEAGIELNCFVILGLPGDTVEGARLTIESLRNRGARVRPTIYTPYDKLRDDMSELDISMFNRQILRREDCHPDVAALYYRLLFADISDVATKVMTRIPINSARA